MVEASENNKHLRSKLSDREESTETIKALQTDMHRYVFTFVIRNLRTSIVYSSTIYKYGNICFRLKESTQNQICELQRLLENSQMESKETSEVNKDLEKILEEQKSVITMQNEKLSDIGGIVEEKEMQIAELNAQMASLKIEHQSQIEDQEASLKRLAKFRY